MIMQATATKMTRLERFIYDNRKSSGKSSLVRDLHEIRTGFFNRRTQLAKEAYSGINYIPTSVLNEMIEAVDPQPHHRIAVFDRHTKTILDLLGCKDVTLFDRGDGFLGTSMKFDIIIGNPPYDLTKSKKIWPDFINKSLELINQGGYVAMVCPSTWLTSNGSAYRGIRAALTSTHDVQLVSRDANDHFSVGINICYFVSQSKPYQSKTLYTENGNVTEINLCDGIPQSGDEKFINDLINKIISFGPGIPWIINDSGPSLVSKSEISDHQSQTHMHKIYQSTNTIGYIGRELSDHGKLKIAVNFSSAFYSAKAADSNMPIVTDEIGSLMGYVTISSVDEGLKMRSYLTSKPIRFLVGNYKKKNTGFSDAVKRRIIPMVPINDWTDTDLYKLFNLTQEEIDHIESVIN